MQYPEPGKRLLRYCGDTIEIRLRSDTKLTGMAFLSTNIGSAAILRNEIIERAESRIPSGGQDWANIPMIREDEFTFSICLALNEEGHFECKACLVPDEDSEPVWVRGDNVHINVAPAAYCCANSIYCAFVRQYGMNISRSASALPSGVTAEQIRMYDNLNYSLIPPSGTFRSLIRRLDHIVGRLKCRIIHLLPVNPVPTTFARMGRFGSPYASLDFTGVDPALAEFDKKATPLDQFIELVDAVHARNARLFIDIAVNHTGWASKLQEEHPDWFVREANGDFHSPGAWGVTWGDLVELDHRKEEVLEYLAKVFLVWCARGVDGFRCDAGYMIPEPAWEYIIARVRREYPETIFLLEGLGGDPAVTSALLDNANMDWAYSELFQNYTREQVEGYLRYAWRQSSSDGLLVHYAETHDNSRLAAVSPVYAKMRTALCALSSVSGAFGFTNGVEWFAKEKIDVHEANALNWDSGENQIALIARLNTILAVHPAFHDGAMLQILDSGSSDSVVFLRESANGRDFVVVCINLNCDRQTEAEWDSSYAESDSGEYTDLISGRRISALRIKHHYRRITLSPGGFVCLSSDNRFMALIQEEARAAAPRSEHREQQQAAAFILNLLCAARRTNVLSGENIPAMAKKLLADPESLLDHFFENGDSAPYVIWHCPEDTARQVMIPPGHSLLAFAPERFRLTVSGSNGVLFRRDSIPDATGRSFLLVPPFPVPGTHTELDISVCTQSRERRAGKLLLLADDMDTVKVSYDRKSIYNRNRTFLQGNGRGAIMHQQMELGRLDSRYDAVLLANLNPEYPENRHIMWRRIRVWIAYHARLQELKHENIDFFRMDRDGGGVWHYHVPVGSGLFVEFTMKMQIVPGRNAVLLTVRRDPASEPKRLPDDTMVRVIISPDVEDRDFHNETKASAGPENLWPSAVTSYPNGFDFAPAQDRILSMRSSRGQFKVSPEWTYMVYQQNEADRGLDPYSDLFSPGYFRFYLSGGESAVLTGEVLRSKKDERIPPVNPDGEHVPPARTDLKRVMLHSMRQFVVKRSGRKTVIAGYPWFLDWGRDTLIAARGLLAAPEFRDDTADILVQFASFAENGTIPNMISGGCASNRDTSDAPLWLFRAVDDYCTVTGSRDFLSRRIRKDETLFDILSSLADAYISGTPNGIRMDPDSGLIFSPPHFTWMDTNYPAGTPREGYPVEIQALWYSALKFLASAGHDPKQNEKRLALAEKVRESFLKYFVLPDLPYLSDCLHASPGTPAAKAVADDHLRPNQLLAVTLGLADDSALKKNILRATQELLIPGAIRSLADRRFRYELPVRSADGTLLNDPRHPYFGRYEGNEDTRRKPAYHNGTAWTWLFPSWAEACAMTLGEDGRRTACSVLSTMILLMDGGCITHIPEIVDGDLPHKPRGCDAQAWGITEFYRVWTLLHRKKGESVT